MIRVVVLGIYMKLFTINAIKIIKIRYTETAIPRIMLVLYHGI